MSFLSKLFFNSSRESYRFLQDSLDWIEIGNPRCDGLPAFTHLKLPLRLYGQETNYDYILEHDDFDVSVGIGHVNDGSLDAGIIQLKTKIKDKYKRFTKKMKKNKEFLT